MGAPTEQHMVKLVVAVTAGHPRFDPGAIAILK